MRDSGRLVLAFSGRTKAGKSTVASSLAEKLGWPSAAFGDYVRDQARRRQQPEEREQLQELGAALIETLGWPEFCRRTLSYACLGTESVPCVVEGVRHVDALMTLRTLFKPAPVYLVHLEISDRARDQRLAQEGISGERGAAWEKHSTEQDVWKTLPARADLVVTVDEHPEQAVDKIIAWLEVA